MTLDVMLVTTAARVESIPELPVVESVRYIVSIQDPDLSLQPHLLLKLQRPDIDIRIYHDTGLARNRNHALEAASADIVMIADDDLIFHPEGIRWVIKAFEEDSALEWVTLHASQPEKRIYPPHGWNLAEPYRFYSPVSFEMAFRRKSLPPQMRFSTLTGIGAPFLGAGEDDLFYHHARKANLHGKFLDIRNVTHPGSTTSVHSAKSIPVIRTKGALLRIMRGFFPGLIRLPLEAWRSHLPFFKALGALSGGFIYSIRHRREL